MEYLWSDAWLLQAIIVANKVGKGSLVDVIAAADTVNHALIGFDEMSSGLNRLSNGNYIKEINGCFLLTERVPREVQQSVLEEGLTNGNESVRNLLGAEKWIREKNVRDHRNNLIYPGLTIDNFRNANREYRQSIGKLIKQDKVIKD